MLNFTTQNIWYKIERVPYISVSAKKLNVPSSSFAKSRLVTQFVLELELILKNRVSLSVYSSVFNPSLLIWTWSIHKG